VPMVSKERLVGGIEIHVGERRGRLSVNEQKVLYALASQAAIFLENARLERDVRSMFLSIIVSMAGAVDAKDAYTHGHSLRVARVALVVAQENGLPRAELEPLLLSAILHDVGKIAIPDHILKKPERLDKEEFEIMKGHPIAGAKMLQHIRALENVIPGILHLKSGLAYVGHGRMVAIAALAKHPALSRYQVLTVDPDEEYAANCILVNDRILVPAKHPRTRAALEHLGTELVELDMSEFQKMDGGLSCLSLRF